MMISQGSYRYFPALLACFIALFAILSSAAMAKILDIDKIVDIAPTKLIPKEAFESQTELLEKTPFDIDALAFSVRLPTGWISNLKMPVELLDSKKALNLSGIISRYVSPPIDYLRSFFSVEVVNLEYNIPIKYWFTTYALSHGYTLEAVTVDPKRDEIEAMYVDVNGDNTYAVRMRAFRSGARMIIVRYSVPMSRFNAEKAMQEQVLSTFALDNIDNSPVEGNKTYGFLTESYFDYPETWRLVPTKIRSINRMKASLAQGEGLKKLDGQMSIFVTSKFEKTSLKNEVRIFKEKIKIPNYELGAFIEKYKMRYHPDMTFGATEIYKMEPTVSTQVDYELWVTLMQNEDYYYIVSLLTPARGAEFYTWARNAEAYKIVVGSMRLYDSSDAMYIQ